MNSCSSEHQYRLLRSVKSTTYTSSTSPAATAARSPTTSSGCPNVFPVTFLIVGVGLRARGLLDEGLTGAGAAYSQTARRWNVLTLEPSGHASINQAAQALGIWPSSLYTQLASLERACGGPLIRRTPALRAPQR
jgi:Bacterial regulatory helix-turn-helix protein, lysR family